MNDTLSRRVKDENIIFLFNTLLKKSTRKASHNFKGLPLDSLQLERE